MLFDLGELYLQGCDAVVLARVRVYDPVARLVRSIGMSGRLISGSVFAVWLVACPAACGSSSAAPSDAGHDASRADGEADAGYDSGCPLAELVVLNANGSCSFVVDGVIDVGGGAGTRICEKGGTFDLVATPSKGFVLGGHPWHDTTTANGASATVVLPSGTKCVWLCCPGVDGGPACPTNDPCR